MKAKFINEAIEIVLPEDVSSIIPKVIGDLLKINAVLKEMAGRGHATSISFGSKIEQVIFPLFLKKFPDCVYKKHNSSEIYELLNKTAGPDLILRLVKIPSPLLTNMGRKSGTVSIDFVKITNTSITLYEHKSGGISMDEAPSGVFQKFDEMIKATNDIVKNNKDVELIILRNVNDDDIIKLQHHPVINYFRNKGVNTVQTAAFFNMTSDEFTLLYSKIYYDTLISQWRKSKISINEMREAINILFNELEKSQL